MIFFIQSLDPWFSLTLMIITIIDSWSILSMYWCKRATKSFHGSDLLWQVFYLDWFAFTSLNGTCNVTSWMSNQLHSRYPTKETFHFFLNFLTFKGRSNVNKSIHFWRGNFLQNSWSHIGQNGNCQNIGWYFRTVT